MCFTIYGKPKNADSEQILGWINCRLFTHLGFLVTGEATFALWPDDMKNPMGFYLYSTYNSQERVCNVQVLIVYL